MSTKQNGPDQCSSTAQTLTLPNAPSTEKADSIMPTILPAESKNRQSVGSEVHDYRLAKLRVFALHDFNGKVCGCGKPNCNAAGKHPLQTNWQSIPFWSEDQFDRIWERQITKSFGVVIEHGMVVADIDPRNGGTESLAKLEKDIGIKLDHAASFAVNTGGGGQHYYFSKPAGVALRSTHPDYPGIDFKSSGYVVGAGSWHASGNVYEVRKGSLPDHESGELFNPAPDALLNLLSTDTKSTGQSSGVSIQTLQAVIEHIPNDDAPYDDWLAIGMALHHASRGADEGFRLWVTWSALSAKHDKSSMRRKWHSFSANRDKVITARTLVYRAREHGYSAVQEALQEFEDLDAEPTSTQSGEWPPIIDLDDKEPPPPLPIDQWPGVLRGHIQSIAKATETPPEMSAPLVLAVTACAVQKLANVGIRPGYTEPAAIFVCPVAEPGERKSAAFSHAIKPLIDWERTARKEAAAQNEKIRIDQTRTQEVIKAKRQQLGKAKGDDEINSLAEEIAKLTADMPAPIPEPRLFTSDVTPEYLGTLMDQNGQALGVFAPEGGLFETMAGRYANSVPNLDIFLNGHAGDPVRVDRGSRPPVSLDHPRVTMGLAIQPEVLRSLNAKPGFRGRGLLARFLFVMPESQLGKRTGAAAGTDDFAAYQFEQMIADMVNTAASRKDDEGLTRVCFDDRAHEVWWNYWQEVEAQLVETGDLAAIRDFGAKLPGAVARIALLFHFASADDVRTALQTKISADTVSAAVETGRVLSQHALVAFGAMNAADPIVDKARLIVRALRRWKRGTFGVREIQQNYKSQFPRVADMTPVLDLLVERGFIRVCATPDKSHGRPRKLYLVNPLLIS